MDQLANAVVAGVPLVAVVIGLVAWVKSLGVEGRALTLVSMGIGLVFGGAYMYATTSPHDFLGWFGLVVYGIALGLIASGIYKVIHQDQKPQE